MCSSSSADLNGDGAPDLAVTNKTTGTVGVLLNQGNGTFAARRNYAAAFGDVALATADLNADGRLDLITANSTNHNVSVLLNTCLP
jgi:hypothetical protein